MSRYNYPPKSEDLTAGSRSSPKSVSRQVWIVLIAGLALLSPLYLAAISQANEYPPSVDFRPCDPAAARCDVELEIVNDRGIPQKAYPVLQDDVDSPNFYGASRAAPLNFYTRRGTLAFNLSAGRFFKMHCRPSTQSIDCAWRGPYRFPLPPDAITTPGNGWRIENYPLAIGTELRISRNPYLEGQMAGRDLFPEKVGVSWTIPNTVPYRGKIILPSFGTPRQPQLTPRERGALGALNDLRAERGAPRLVAQPDLNAAADNYACWLASPAADPWKHLNGHRRFGTPSQRSLDAGWPSGSSETIAFNAYSPENGLQGLLNSDGHRRILLDPEQIWTGIAYGCGNLIITPTNRHRVYPYTPEPFGGWGNDIGDSSLAQWDDDDGDWGDEEWFPRRFSPRLFVLRKYSRQPTLSIRANRGARGTMKVRYRGKLKSTGPLSARLKVGRSGRVRIRFKATSDSTIRSGTVIRCLRALKGRVAVRHCRRP